VSRLLRNLVIVGVGVAMLGGAAAGALLLLHRKRPDLQRVLIETRAPGSSPEAMEATATVPVERALTGIPGLVDMESLSAQGRTLVRVGVSPDTPLPIFLEAARTRLTDAHDAFPLGLSPPLSSIPPRSDASLHYTVDSKVEDVSSLRTLNDWDVRQVIERVPGVAGVATCGGLVKRLEILPGPARMNAHGVPLSAIVDAIGALPPAGLAMHGEVTSLEQVGYLQIGMSDGVPLPLREVARVAIGYAPRTCTALRDGKEDVVEGIIDLQLGEDPSRVIPRVAETLAEVVANKLPRGVQIRPLDFALPPSAAGVGRTPSLRLRLSSPAEVSLPAIAEAVRRTAEVTDVLILKGEVPGDGMWHVAGDLEALIALDPRSKRPIPAVALEIADGLAKLPGVRYDLSTTAGELPAELHARVLRISGADLEQLRAAAEQTVSALGDVRGASALGVVRDDDEPRLEVKLDSKRLAMLGVSPQDAYLAVEAATGGHVAGSYREGEKRFDLVIRSLPPEEGGAKDLGWLTVRAKDGGLVPLSQVASMEMTASPTVSRIRRRNGARFLAVALDVRGRDMKDFLAEARQRVAEKVKLPVGVSLAWEDEAP